MATYLLGVVSVMFCFIDTVCWLFPTSRFTAKSHGKQWATSRICRRGSRPARSVRGWVQKRTASATRYVREGILWRRATCEGVSTSCTGAVTTFESYRACKIRFLMACCFDPPSGDSESRAGHSTRNFCRCETNAFGCSQARSCARCLLVGLVR